MIKLILAILLAVFLFSCSVIEKSRDNKALARIYSRTDLSTQAYTVLEKQHPCINTITEYIKGKDSIIIDSSYSSTNIIFLNNYIDSLQKEIIKNPSQQINIDSLKKEIEKKCNPKTVYVYRTDSIRWEDKKALNEAIADVNTKQGEIIQLNTQVNDLKTTNKKKLFWIFGLGGFICLATFLRVKRII